MGRIGSLGLTWLWWSLWYPLACVSLLEHLSLIKHLSLMGPRSLFMPCRQAWEKKLEGNSVFASTCTRQAAILTGSPVGAYFFMMFVSG